MTLFEVLIVVALIGLLAASLVFGSGLLSSSRQRGAATMIVSAVRLLQARATSTGRPTRLVFDLEEHSITLEQARGSRMLRVKEGEESTGGGAEAATAAEQAARKEVGRILEGPQAPRARFAPLAGARFGKDGKGASRSLGRGVSFRQVQTAHDEVPRSSGRAYLYFWPGGETEEAAIQLTTSPEASGVTIRVSALTGRAKITRGRVELPEPREDGVFSEREE